jgi:hypothetical protein
MILFRTEGLTASQVGYGDMVPSSEAGRFMAVMTSLFGIMTISVPISVVTMNFHQVPSSTLCIVFLHAVYLNGM